jgi:4-hydroxy-tetrahydrodipicolinate synthase
LTARAPPDVLAAVIQGVFAAAVTPVHDDGRVDPGTFDRLLDFLLERGVDGVCLGGATSEYPHFETGERKVLLRRAAARLPPDRSLLAGIGAPSMRLVLDLGETAKEAGSRALLLPMPMFFRYRQEDLEAYCAQVAEALRAPCLLYNLPDFTNGLAPETAVRLLRSQEFLTGIKDSSGQAANLELFATARSREPWTLLAGDDRLFVRSLEAGWNGTISGVAGFCPELVTAIARSVAEGAREEIARLSALLDELIDEIAPLPTPWGIRAGLSARGIDTGPFPLPLAAARLQQIAAFKAWLPGWLERSGLVPAGAGAGRPATRS